MNFSIREVKDGMNMNKLREEVTSSFDFNSILDEITIKDDKIYSFDRAIKELSFKENDYFDIIDIEPNNTCIFSPEFFKRLQIKYVQHFLLFYKHIYSEFSNKNSLCVFGINKGNINYVLECKNYFLESHYILNHLYINDFHKNSIKQSNYDSVYFVYLNKVYSKKGLLFDITYNEDNEIILTNPKSKPSEIIETLIRELGI